MTYKKDPPGTSKGLRALPGCQRFWSEKTWVLDVALKRRWWRVYFQRHLYLDLPRGAEWMVRGVNSPSFRIKQHRLEDAGIVTHPWNLTWIHRIHATNDLSNILNSRATLYVHPWNDMETKNHPFGKEHHLPNRNYCVSMSTFLLVYRSHMFRSSIWTKLLLNLMAFPPRSLGVQC